MASLAGRIAEPTFKGVIGTLFTCSVLTATARTVIRIRNQRRLLFDDVMLIFACTTLLAATVLLYSMMSVMYLVQEMTLNPIPATLVQASAAGFSERMSQYSQLMFSFLALAWTTVFAVKFCFLLFFYQMLVRVPNLMYICKIVFGITILCYCICVCGIFIACPRVGLESLNCAQRSGFLKNFAFGITEISLDITTDLLIIMIPILLLWKVQIKARQKLLLGVFLCLSICMIAVAIVRISGLRIRHTIIDVQWQAFWLEVEATIAVNVVSITAFRSVLGIKASKAREKNRSWYSYRRRHLSRKSSKDPENNPDTDELSSIPGVVSTEMRTVPRGNRDSGLIFCESAPRKSKDDWSLPEQNIKTAYKMTYGSEIKTDPAPVASFV